MENNKDLDLQPIIIDLDIKNNGGVNESFLASFGGAISHIMRAMFGNKEMANKFAFKGTKSQIQDFAGALGGEKRFIKQAAKFGLDDPRVLKDKYKLQKATSKFERSTGIKWPFKNK